MTPQELIKSTKVDRRALGVQFITYLEMPQVPYEDQAEAEEVLRQGLLRRA